MCLVGSLPLRLVVPVAFVVFGDGALLASNLSSSHTSASASSKAGSASRTFASAQYCRSLRQADAQKVGDARTPEVLADGSSTYLKYRIPPSCPLLTLSQGSPLSSPGVTPLGSPF